MCPSDPLIYRIVQGLGFVQPKFHLNIGLNQIENELMMSYVSSFEQYSAQIFAFLSRFS
jgi:hypothetical protein